LAGRRDNPRVESSRLSGMTDCYKIKLRAAGYRLVYQAFDERVVVVVVAVGKREDSAVYRKAGKQLK
jgi:mRNA interferase RelE/StbE